MNVRRLWRSSISAKIILMVWGVSLLPLLLLGVYGSIRLEDGHAEITAQERAALKQLALQQAHNTTILLSRDLNNQLQSAEHLLQLLQQQVAASYRTPAPPLPSSELQRDPSYGFYWSHTYRGSSTAWVSSAYSLTTELNQDLGHYQEIDQLLRNGYEATGGRFANVYYNTASGLGLIYPASDLPSLVRQGLLVPDLRFTDVPFFALADPQHNPQRKLVWTPPYLDQLGQGWMVSAATPVYRADGSFHGVVGIDLTIQTLLANLRDSSSDHHQYTLLLDQSGLVIAAPASSHAELGWPAEIPPGRFNLAQHGAPAWQAAITQLLEQGRLSSALELADGKHYLFAERVPTTGWYVVRGLPEADIYSHLEPMLNSSRNTLQEIGRNFLLALVLTLAIGSLVGFMLVRQIVRPLRSFTQQVAASGGETGPLLPVTVSGEDEVGRLAAAFNHMVAELNARSGQIEQQQKLLQARNAELTALNAVISSIHRSLNLSDVYRTALEQSQHVLSCEYGMVYLDEGGSLRIEYAQLPEEVLQVLPVSNPRGLSDEVRRLGRPVISTNLGDDVRVTLPRQYRGGLRAYLGVPLQHAGTFYGVLAVLTESERHFNAREIGLLQAIGEQVGLAIANAQLYADLQSSYAELAAAQEEITRAHRLQAIGQLASGVAHDFNNLLTGIIGFTHLLLLDEQDPERRHLLRSIDRTAQDGAATVARLQEFGRVRRDQPGLPVDLNAIVHEAIELTRPRWHAATQVPDAALTLLLELDPLPLIYGEPAGLREVMINLILNALDAMPSGGRLCISTRRHEQTVLLQVADTGVGMPPEVCERIFEPFFSTKGSRGYGLGLPMVEAIITHHAGSVSVASTPGQGTCFSIELPLRLAEPQREQEAQPVRSTPLRILVADDDPLVLSSLVELLRRWGHQVQAASDGPSALALFAPQCYDVVITDLGMPQLSGWEVIKSIRSRDPQVQIILMTGWGKQIEQHDVQQAGADALLSKPYVPAQLQQLLAERTAIKRAAR